MSMNNEYRLDHHDAILGPNDEDEDSIESYLQELCYSPVNASQKQAINNKLYTDQDQEDEDADEDSIDSYLRELCYSPVDASQKQAVNNKIYTDQEDEDDIQQALFPSEVSTGAPLSQHQDLDENSTDPTGSFTPIPSYLNPAAVQVCESPKNDPSPVHLVCQVPSASLFAEEKFSMLMKQVPYFAIPRHYGFIRKVIDVPVSMDGGGDDASFQRVAYEHDKSSTPLNSIEEVHKYLLRENIPLPISCFTFEARINPHSKHFKNCWKHITAKDDLSEGKERNPIPVICSESRSVDKLGTYVVDSFMEENMNLRLEHDDGFFVCCECPNDCQDKLNCPCFQLTLENCSRKTRNIVGDVNLGYHYQRLYKSILSGLYECNRMCKCRKSTCLNRVVQNGIICSLQLFKTRLCGYGVRTLCDIPRGSFICTYAGEIVSGQYADKISSNWHRGKWKYLTGLQVADEYKDGYESDVVEPESTAERSSANCTLDATKAECDVERTEMQLKEGDETINKSYLDSETNRIVECNDAEENEMEVSGEEEALNEPLVVSELKSEEWVEFISGAVSPEPHNGPPFPATFPISNSLNGMDDSQETKVSHSFSQPVSTSAKSSERNLRSSNIVNYECPWEYELLPTGRVGLTKTSLKDVIMLSRHNSKSDRLSKVCITSCKSKSFRRKSTTHMFLEDYLRKPSEEEDLWYKNLNLKNEKQKKYQERSIKKLSQSSLLSKEYVKEIVDNMKMPGIKLMETKPCKGIIHSALPKFTVKKASKAVINSFQNKLKAGGKKFKRKRRGKKLLKYTATKRRVRRPYKVHPLLDLSFNIDGLEKGNIGRYFNHSCDPNIIAQYVFTNSHDLRIPRIAFFADRDILAGEELTWNYHYEGQIEGDDILNSHQQKEVHQLQVHLREQSDDDNDAANVNMTEVSCTRKRFIFSKKTGRYKRKTRTKMEYIKRTKTRIECHCGQDNCRKRIC